uniref:Target of brain insulin-like 1 alpha glucosidase n=1 Tax=Platynereis dumerilii TaxID=6359 RepID=A0A6B9MS22_PLADU|nr:target of brain insulin-like 1 alpha glucosidase [Platynereis dumerilii]
MEPITFHTINLEPRLPFKLNLFSSEDANQIVYSSTIGTAAPKGVLPIIQRDDEETLKITWSDELMVTIKYYEYQGGHRYDVSWEVIGKKVVSVTDVVALENGHWYGGAQVRKQTWPIEDWTQKMEPYVAGDSFAGQWGGVLERYWLCSSGVALYIDYDVPLSVGIAKKQLSMQAKWVDPYNNVDSRSLKLKYTILQGENIKVAHLMASEAFIQRPSDIPDELMFRYPIWSTWAKYKKDIDQKVVEEFASEIDKHQFPGCQIDVDDDWTTSYGDMDFDKKKFPKPAEMVSKLNEKGYRVTLWVHPFASPMSNAVKKETYWVGSTRATNTGTWWNGVGKSLDVTDEKAAEWFKQSLKDLQEKYGVTSFKFDAGELNWLPGKFTTKQAMINPCDYSTRYAQLAHEIDSEGRSLEVRVGTRTQNLPVFVRMMDKDSEWDEDNGLKTIIPHALTFSILGYPFILPDMIGGNAYAKVLGIAMPGFIASMMNTLPDRELYIRWMQVSTFLPCMQFSIAPWQYDEEVVDIARNLVKIHEEFADTLIELAHESCETGAPIIRPMWWLAPEDEEALTTDSQFLVGNDIVVAPILEKKALKRNIYLPPGSWRDINDEVHEGPVILENFMVTLEELPFFIRE